MENILNSMPEYAKDTKLNYSGIINNHSLLSETQYYGLLLVTAITCRNSIITNAITEKVKQHLDEKTIQGV